MTFGIVLKNGYMFKFLFTKLGSYYTHLNEPFLPTRVIPFPKVIKYYLK